MAGYKWTLQAPRTVIATIVGLLITPLKTTPRSPSRAIFRTDIWHAAVSKLHSYTKARICPVGLPEMFTIP